MSELQINDLIDHGFEINHQQLTLMKLINTSFQLSVKYPTAQFSLRCFPEEKNVLKNGLAGESSVIPIA